MHNVGMANLLTTVQRYTEHVVTVQGLIGLPGTDDYLRVKESRLFLRAFLGMTCS